MAEFKAGTVEDAIRIGLETLGIAREDAEIEVLDEGGRLFHKAKVRVEPKADAAQAEPVTGAEKAAETAEQPAEEQEKRDEAAPAERAKEEKNRPPRSRSRKEKPAAAAPEQKEEERPLSEDAKLVCEFVRDMAERLDADCELSAKETSERITVTVSGAGAGKLIGYRGDVLDAVQYIASVLVNRDRKRYKRITVDCENYREKREESLVKLAERLAEKAVRTGRKVRLEPMNPAERRVIHSALQKNEEVDTVSVGTEPNRYLTIVPKNLLDDVEERADRRGGRGDRRRDGGKGRRERDGGRDGRSRGGARPAKKSSFLGFGSYLGNTKSSLEREIYEERKREFENNRYTEPEPLPEEPEVPAGDAENPSDEN